MSTKSKRTTLQQSTFANTFTTASHQNTSLACVRKTRTHPSLPSPSKSRGKLHDSRKTLSDPSPTATQISKTTKTANYPIRRNRGRPPQPPRIANADGIPATQPIPLIRLTLTLMLYPWGHLRSPLTPHPWTRYYSMPQTGASSPPSPKPDYNNS